MLYAFIQFVLIFSCISADAQTLKSLNNNTFQVSSPNLRSVGGGINALLKTSDFYFIVGNNSLLDNYSCLTFKATITPSGPTTILQGQTVSLTANAGASYLWSNGATTKSIEVNTAGSYTVTVSTANACSATSEPTTVSKVPKANIVQSDTTICAGSPITLSVDTTGFTNSNTTTLPANLQNGLVAYYPFNGNANDESGNGNNGTPMNGVLLSTDRFNNPNSAYSFDGIDDRIFVNNPIFNNGSNFTFSGWYYLNNLSNSNNRHNSHCILNTSPHNGLAFGMNFFSSNKYSLFVGDGTPSYGWGRLFNAESNQNITTNSWKFVTLIKSSTTYYLYVNGILDQTWVASGPVQSYLYKLYFGGTDPMNSNEVLDGKLDDIAIYNRALSASEVQKLYTSNQAQILWSTGATTPSITVNPSTTTTYTASITSGGVGSTDSVKVIVDTPTASITVSGPTTFCAGGSVTLTATAASSYLWSNGATTQSITVNTAGNYSVTVTNANGCSATSVATAVTVNPLPTATITAGGPTTITQTGNVLLSANTGTGYAYQWYKDGIAVSSAISSNYTATTSGSYTVKVINNATGCELISTAIQVKTVYVLPANNFQVVVRGETCRTSNDGKISIGTVQSQSYTATLSQLSQTVKTTNFTTTVELANLAAGNYTLCITVAGQAEYKQCYDIIINEPQDLSVYSQVNPVTNTLNLIMSGSDTYTINLNGRNYTSNKSELNLPLQPGLNKIKVNANQACQGIYTEEVYVNEQVELYPNPFSTSLNIKIENKEGEELSVKVLNGTGRTVYQASHRVTNNLVSLDLNTLESGYYFVVIGNRTYKVIKK